MAEDFAGNQYKDAGNFRQYSYTILVIYYIIFTLV